MDHLTIIDAETERFIEAVGAAPGEGRVPTCPDWTVDDLLWHLTEAVSYTHLDVYKRQGCRSAPSLARYGNHGCPQSFRGAGDL